MLDTVKKLTVGGATASAAIMRTTGDVAVDREGATDERQKLEASGAMKAEADEASANSEKAKNRAMMFLLLAFACM